MHLRKTNTKTNTKTVLLISISVLFILLLTGAASAETITVTSGQQFLEAVEQINSNSESDNTIIILNDIELTESQFSLQSSAYPSITGINYTASGNLKIQSDSSVSRRVYSNFTDTLNHPFFNISGNDTTVEFENVIFDKFGISAGGLRGSPVVAHDIILKNAQVINSDYSGIQVFNTANMTLENVSVSGCSYDQGGGISLINCENLIIRDCNVSNNKAWYSTDNHYDSITGGGIYMYNSSVDICGDTVISDNVVEDTGDNRPKGGGIDADESHLKIYDNVVISNNSVNGAYLAVGGGIFANLTQYKFESYTMTTSLEIYGNVTISDNKALTGGGIHVNKASDSHSLGVFNISGDVQIIDNIAEKSSTALIKNTSYGGGVYTHVPVNISGNVLIQNNKATDLSSSPELTTGGGVFSQGDAVISDNVRILDNEADYGGGVCTFSPIVVEDKVLISGNHGYVGGGLYLMNTSYIRDNVTVSENDADFAGGGIYFSKMIGEISDNVVISNNTAGSYPNSSSVGGGGIFVNNSTITISGNTLISDNTAQNGGGLFGRYSNSIITLSNNTTFENNTANESVGYGGAIMIFSGSKIVVSGDSGQTVSFLKNSAYADGGAVYLGDLYQYGSARDVSAYALFAKTTDDSNLVFSENTAQNGCLWNLTDPDSNLTAEMKYIRDNLPLLNNTTVTQPFSNAYNDFDIVFYGGEIISPALVTIQYYYDEISGTPAANETFDSYTGAEITADTIASELGNDWLNFYRKTDYKSGALQETLPMTLSGDTVLTVLYVKDVPVTVTVNYYDDNVSGTPVNTESFDSFEGTELTADMIASELGNDWLNLYRKTDYKSGALQETLPLTLSGDTVLTVLYVQNESGGNPGGGGNGTGNATVIDPKPPSAGPETSVPPGDGGSGGGIDTAPVQPVIVILLFMIAVACFAYTLWEEREIEQEIMYTA
ncbi:hypothetical protein MmiHf6_11530 [Methanimicrococcus hongohii]|uniref:Right handed beta helix domain-containing protein n=1 Tax=Methanimicrococcus hongohii TaxID=3028295 RepID=A0AA96V013_9EURY|nr:right-handed parallel beta-helix repeat-containing protein [Methanimicrococcus sp. Hf6]WNY23831.1 hypothetical protein MmiHf6_11530 [Methanimicrococcus sp. Hf6]